MFGRIPWVNQIFSRFGLTLLAVALIGQAAFATVQEAENKKEQATTPADTTKIDQVKDVLLTELNDLTPGGIKEKPELKEGIMTAIRAFVENDANGAMEQLDRLRTNNPQLPPAALMLAALYYTVGNQNEGAKWLEDAANSNPELPTIYTAFARLAIAQGRKTDAMVLLEKTKTLITNGKWSEEDVKLFNLMHNDAMADLMLLQSNFGAAREYLDALIKERPDMAKAIMRLAQVDFRQGKMDDCLKRLEDFRKVVTDSRVPEMMMATMVAQGGSDAGSEEWVKKALAKYPKEKNVLIEYVDWMVAHERFEEANAVLGSAEEQIGLLPAVLLLKGKIAFATMKYDEAEKLFIELRASEPSNVEISTMLAISMAESNDADKLAKALEIAKQNAQLQPQNPVTLSVLGWVFFKQNNIQAAGEWLTRSAQSGQLPPESAYYIAKFLQVQGEKTKSSEFVENALKSTGLFLYRRPAMELQNMLAPKEDTLQPPKK